MRLVPAGCGEFEDAPGFCNGCGEETLQGVTLCGECRVAKTLDELVAEGEIDLNCPRCAETIAAIRAGLPRPMGPSHKPSRFCESGKRPHCTCDTCF